MEIAHKKIQQLKYNASLGQKYYYKFQRLSLILQRNKNSLHIADYLEFKRIVK